MLIRHVCRNCCPEVTTLGDLVACSLECLEGIARERPCDLKPAHEHPAKPRLRGGARSAAERFHLSRRLTPSEGQVCYAHVVVTTPRARMLENPD